MTVVSKIAKNTVSVLLGTLVRMASSFLLMLLIARYLGASGMGQYTVVLSLFWIFQRIATMGLEQIIIREVAKDEAKAGKFLTIGIVISLLSAVIMISAMLLFARIAKYDDVVITSASFISGAILFTTLNMVFQSIFIAFEKAELSLYANIVGGMTKLCLGVYLLHTGHGVIAVSAVFTVSSIVGLLVNILLTQKYVFHIKLDFDRKTFTWFIKTMPVFAGSQIVNAFSGNITAIILSLLLNIEQVGYYGAAMQLVGAIRMVIQSYKVAIQPVTAKTFEQSIRELKRFCLKSMRFISMLTIPVSVGTTMLAARVVPLIYKEDFEPSIILLQILIWIVYLYGLSMVMTAILIASNDQKIVFQTQIVSLITRIAFSFALIPLISYWGAAVAVLISSCVNFGYKYRYLHKNMFTIPFFQISWRILISTAGMAIILMVFASVNVYILVVIAATVFGILQVLQGELKLNEKMVFKTFMRKHNQVTK